MIGGQSRLGEVIMTNGPCRRESHRHRESMLFFHFPIFGICKVGGRVGYVGDTVPITGLQIPWDAYHAYKGVSRY